MAYETIGGGQYIIDTDAKTDFLDDLISRFNHPSHEQNDFQLTKNTLLEYFALMLSSMASTLGFSRSSGEIWTKSEMVVF